MERVLNKEMQPLVLEDGTVLAAAGTKEAGPRDVELSAKDRKLYVDRGRLTILKPAANQTASQSFSGQGITKQLADLLTTQSDKSGKAGK
jgi:hypothetical protein